MASGHRQPHTYHETLNVVYSTTYTPLVLVSTTYTTNFMSGLRQTLRGSSGLRQTPSAKRHNPKEPNTKLCSGTSKYLTFSNKVLEYCTNPPSTLVCYNCEYFESRYLWVQSTQTIARLENSKAYKVYQTTI